MKNRMVVYPGGKVPARNGQIIPHNKLGKIKMYPNTGRFLLKKHDDGFVICRRGKLVRL